MQSKILYLKSIKKILEYMLFYDKKDEYVYLAFFNRYLVRNNTFFHADFPVFKENLKMVDVDYDGDFGEVFYGVNDKKYTYFNIHDKDIDLSIIFNDKQSGMKILNNTEKINSIDLNVLVYALFAGYKDKFSKKYLEGIEKYNLYI